MTLLQAWPHRTMHLHETPRPPPAWCALRLLHEVRVRPQREARVGVAEVLAHRLDRLALVKRGAGVEVTQGMAPCTRSSGTPAHCNAGRPMKVLR